MPALPQGTVTFLFSDIEGSTRLLQGLGDGYADVLADHQRLLRAAFQAADGHEVHTAGDSFFVAFHRATDAAAAAVAAQRAIATYPWPEDVQVRARMGLHTGEPTLAAGDYVGLDVHRAARICAAGHGGQILLSQTTRDLVAHDLPEGVSLRALGEHRLKDLYRPERLFQLVIPDLLADFPALKSLDSQPNNLPAQPTPLIGREQEGAAVCGLLRREDVRLLTLTGPAGTGKTRLGLQVAADLIDDFADGAFFVPLAPISDPGLVTSTIAQTLGVREASGQPLLESLQDALRAKQMLLLLDNFEQVVAAALVVAELLIGCPRLKILVTSREVLHLRGEHEFPVPPLALPNLTRLPTSAPLSQYAAVALFIQCAVAVKPNFAVTNENAPAVAEICIRLDGLPLAIELAAARIRLLTPQAMLTRLNRRLALLTGGPRDLPARQQTLRNAIAWSYDLLEPTEQTVFHRLAVFAGGCSLEAAEAIIGGAGPVCEPEVLKTVAALVDKSLLRQEETTGGEPRFRMLETIREYALEQLEASGEAASLRQQHAAFYLALAEQAEPELFGPQTAAWLDRLEQEHDNLRATLRWFVEHAEVEHALHLGAALGRFWRMHGHLTEGRERLLALLSATGAGSHRTVARAKVLLAAGWLARDQADYNTARTLLAESLALARELGDKHGIAWSLTILGVVARYQGDHAAARAQLEEGLTVARALGDKVCIAATVGNLGLVARDQGDYNAARHLLEQSLAAAREVGDSLGIAWPLTNLGLIAQYQGEYATAHALHTEALEVYRILGDRQNIAHSLNNLGLVATAQVDYATALLLFQESLYILSEVRDNRGIAFVLEGLACVAAGQHQPQRALRLAGAAGALREAIGATSPPSWQQMYAGYLEAVRQAVGAHDAAAASAAGRAMSLPQAIAYAAEAPGPVLQ